MTMKIILNRIHQLFKTNFMADNQSSDDHQKSKDCVCIPLETKKVFKKKFVFPLNLDWKILY